MRPYASICSHPGSSHRAFSPVGANDANEDLSEAVMFADMSKDGRQGGRERGRLSVMFVLTDPPTKG